MLHLMTWFLFHYNELDALDVNHESNLWLFSLDLKTITTSHSDIWYEHKWDQI